METYNNSDLTWQRLSEVLRERHLAYRRVDPRPDWGLSPVKLAPLPQATRDRLARMSRGMSGATSTDLASLRLGRLFEVRASLYDMREKGQQRAEHLLDELCYHAPAAGDAKKGAA